MEVCEDRRCGEVCVRGRRCGEVCVRGRRCGEVCVRIGDVGRCV